MRDPETVPWLVISLVLSVLLTVLLNMGLRVFPDASRRIAREATKLMSPTAEETERATGPSGCGCLGRQCFSAPSF